MSELEVLRAENVRLREALIDQLNKQAGILGLDPETHKMVNAAIDSLATQREIDRNKALEKVVEAARNAIEVLEAPMVGARVAPRTFQELAKDASASADTAKKLLQNALAVLGERK
jgi:hypothetical protein